MMNPVPDIFVANIGLRSVTICGEKSNQFLNLDNSRFSRGCSIIDFSSEDLMLFFLQSLIDKKIPFESTYKNDSRRDAIYFRNVGKLTGTVISFDWGVSGAIYKSE